MKTIRNYKGEDVTEFIDLVNKAYLLKQRYNDEPHIRYYNGMHNCLQIAMFQDVAAAWEYYKNIPSLI